MDSTRFADSRAIIRLGLPILIGQLGSIVVGFADNIMVGRYSTEALASASFVNNVFNVAIFACMGFTYGITPLAGSMFARGDRRSVGALMRGAVRLNVVFTALIMAVMAVVYFNVGRMGQPDELLPVIRPYFLIYLSSMLFVALFNAFAQWAYAINRSDLPMWIVLGANVLNIAGNYALIYGHWGMPELGLTGAGISTLVSRVLACAAMMAVFFMARRYGDYSEGYRTATAASRRVGLLLRTSLPVALQMTFESASFTVVAIMAGWLGTVSLAAYQVVVITGTLGFCVYYSIGSAIAVRVANACGTGTSRDVRRVGMAGYRIMLVLMVVASLIFLLGGRHIIGVFTDDAAVLTLAVSVIFPLILYQVADATQITFANALRGTSHVMPMMWIAFMSYIVAGVPASYLLAFTAGMGLYGLVLSFSVSLFIAAGLFLYFFMRVTRGNAPEAAD